MPSTKSGAIAHVKDKLSGVYHSIMWPTVAHDQIRFDLEQRIYNPDLIWQSQSNTCGMASFFHALAEDDPYLYAYYVCSMYLRGSAYLGYGKDAPIVSASKLTRSSKVPPMSSVDWIALASLRDYLNNFLDYNFDAGIPGLKDIPLLGFLGSPKLIEAVGGITWPTDLANILLAVGYQVQMTAAINRVATLKDLYDANSLFKNGYRIFLLIHTCLAKDNPSAVTTVPEHWVHMVDLFNINASGVRATVFDPAWGQRVYLPNSGKQIPIKNFCNNLFGYVAGRR
jgi:hypothetical protein